MRACGKKIKHNRICCHVERRDSNRKNYIYEVQYALAFLVKLVMYRILHHNIRVLHFSLVFPAYLCRQQRSTKNPLAYMTNVTTYFFPYFFSILHIFSSLHAILIGIIDMDLTPAGDSILLHCLNFKKKFFLLIYKGISAMHFVSSTALKRF